MANALKAVAPQDIQSALDQIWESLETTNVARACLFNLIFYTKKDQRIPYVQRLAQKVIEKFPSRVIFVTADKMSPSNTLKTEVSILTSSKGEFDVACDYIQIDATGSSLEQIPFVVLPHLLPDLPVYLLLAEDPTQEDPVCTALQKFAHRLIFDSETTDSLVSFATTLLYQHQKLKIDIADLNWARLESFREMLSMAFYSDENLTQIRRCKTIQISYNAQKTPFFCHTKIQALYLQAWLSSQLEWTFCSSRENNGSLVLLYKGAAGPVEVTLIPIESTELPPGLVLSVEITTQDDEHFFFKRDTKLIHQITFQHSTKERCDLPCHYVFSKVESGHSLIKEICHRGTSSHFLSVLRLFQTWGETPLC